MTSDDDNCIMEALTGRPAAATSRRHGRHVRSSQGSHSRVDSDAVASSSDEDNAEFCALCEEELHGVDKSRATEFGMKPLHKSCYNALHALKRITSKNPKVAKAADQCRKMAPKRFRAAALALRTTEKHARSADDRLAAAGFVEEMCREVIQDSKQKFLLLPKAPFVSWFMWHEGITEQQAFQRWRDAKRDGNIQREVIDGRVCLAVKQYKELSTIDRLRSSKRMQVDGDPHLSARDDRKRVMDKRTGLGADGDRFLGGVGKEGAAARVAVGFDSADEERGEPVLATPQKKGRGSSLGGSVVGDEAPRGAAAPNSGRKPQQRQRKGSEDDDGTSSDGNPDVVQAPVGSDGDVDGEVVSPKRARLVGLPTRSQLTPAA